MVLLFSLVLLSTFAAASPGPRLCGQDKSVIHARLALNENRISFKNGGGLINGGVCWWHNRLQRSSLYLARFNPAASKPNGAQIRGILSALKNMNQVVTIGGYKNFFDFTRGEQPSVQALLEAWQKEDGILYFQWIRGLSGKHRLPARDLAIRMAEISRYVAESPMPVWVMAQMPGITSHSFLIRGIDAFSDGMRLEVVDSNAPLELRYIRYRRGDESLRLEKGGKEFVLYTGFQKDFSKIKSTLAQFCHWNPHSLMADSLFGAGAIPLGEIEAQDP